MIRFLRQAVAALWFTAFFLWELLLANIKVARDVARKEQLVQPGIVAVPLRARTRTQIALLSNLVSLTPGTIVIDISSDRQVLYLHVMYLPDIVGFDNFQDRFLRIFR